MHSRCGSSTVYSWLQFLRREGKRNREAKIETEIEIVSEIIDYLQSIGLDTLSHRVLSLNLKMSLLIAIQLFVGAM